MPSNYCFLYLNWLFNESKEVFMLKFILLFIAFVLPITASAKDGSHSNLSKEELKKMVIIDVRTQGEWNYGHLEDAILIPLNVITKEITNKVKDKNTPIALYCRSGNRSGVATQQLRQMGYTNVENYGGFNQASRTLGKKIVTSK